jgi:hypothetical protein
VFPKYIHKFGAGLKEELPHISTASVKKLIAFASTYQRETEYTRQEKTKPRNRLNAEQDTRIQFSLILPDVILLGH